jgi:hypothetical protein
MHTATFFPLGNADCCMIDLRGGEKLLFDFADVDDPDDPTDKRIDLPGELRNNLRRSQRDRFDVVAFTHADDDHVHGMSAFFHLDHAVKYQDSGRVKINQLWVPAAVVTEPPPNDDARILQAEVWYRLRQGRGVRVFSRPDGLREWLAKEGLDFSSVAHLITDAGQLIPGFDKFEQGVEFFVHSPFAVRDERGVAIDLNKGSLVLQAEFLVEGSSTRLMLSADTLWENFARIVVTTESHRNTARLEWDIFKLSHHCSYKSLGPDKGTDVTTPHMTVARLYEAYGADNGLVVSTSKPIPSDDADDQPPHRQAANYYKGVVTADKFLVTMEHPTQAKPEPLVIVIDGFGPMVRKSPVSGNYLAARQSAPRAGAPDA